MNHLLTHPDVLAYRPVNDDGQIMAVFNNQAFAESFVNEAHARNVFPNEPERIGHSFYGVRFWAS